MIGRIQNINFINYSNNLNQQKKSEKTKFVSQPQVASLSFKGSRIGKLKPLIVSLLEKLDAKSVTSMNLTIDGKTLCITRDLKNSKLQISSGTANLIAQTSEVPGNILIKVEGINAKVKNGFINWIKNFIGNIKRKREFISHINEYLSQISKRLDDSSLDSDLGYLTDRMNFID